MTRSVLIGWGIGSFTSSVLINAVGLLHLRFMTDSLGLAIGLAGSLVVVSRFYDTVLDPLVGALSDRSQTPWGRYRPYLLGGGLLCALSLTLMFNVPVSLSGVSLVAYVTASLLLFSTAYTLFRIPYLAIGRSITQNFAERSRLMTFSVYGSSLGGMAATSAAPLLLSRMGSGRAGHGVIALILAGIITCGAIVTFLLLAEPEASGQNHPAAAKRHVSARAALDAFRDNRPFQRLIAFKVCVFAGLAVHISAIPYYTRYVLRAPDTALSSIFLMQSLAMMASQFLWVRVARRFGRRNGLIAAALGSATTMIGWSLVRAAAPNPWVQILGGCEGLFGGGLFFGLYTVLTDTMDFARTRTLGEGQEGVLAGIFVMVEKGTAAFGAFVFSTILGAVGYVSAHNAGAAAQPAGVITGIYAAIAFVPATTALIATLLIRGYHLPKFADGAAPAPVGSALGLIFAIGGAVAIGRPGPVHAADLPPSAASPATMTLTVPTHFMVKRVYAGPDGKSRMDEVELPRVGGGDGRSISTRLFVTDVEMGISLPGQLIDWHRVSTPRLLIILTGQEEIGLGDGSKHILKAGDMVYVTDLVGQGHTSRSIGTIPVEGMTARLNLDNPLKPKLNACPETMAASACVANGLTITSSSH